jgi:hypothetical protein
MEHQGQITEIVAHVKKDVKKIERPLAEIEHKIGHLEESIDKKIDEKTLSDEENFVDKILKSSNTEKLIEYTINDPRAKKIIKDIIEEKLQEFRKEVTKEYKKLQDNFSNDFKQITHNAIYFGIAVTVVTFLLIAAYSH